MVLNFPVGFQEFHKDKEINFQMNRWYSLGIVSEKQMKEIGECVSSFEEWTELFCNLAEIAKKEGRMEQCATYYRAAQFFVLGDRKEKDGTLLKLSLYEKCFDAYEQAYKQEEVYVYERIPFESVYLPVIKLLHKEKSKGTIVVHGGYDSFMQEFVRYLLYLYQAGYDIYMFEGPGQGEVLCRCQLKMTPNWETCVKAVLDYYGLTHVTLIGISLGGYLATRAAAYEPRVDRLVMFDLIYDFYGALMAQLSPSARRLMDFLTRHPNNPLWNMTEKKMNKSFFLNWLFEQGYYIYEGVHTPCEYFNCIKQYNTRELSQLIRQDVLVLAGESDIYTVFLKEQVDALVNARSVTRRLFTKEESADHHCQIGNTKLVLDTILEWIDRKTLKKER